MASPGGPLGPHPKGYRSLTLPAVPPVSEGGLPWKRGHCGAGSPGGCPPGCPVSLCDKLHFTYIPCCWWAVGFSSSGLLQRGRP